MDGRIKTDLLLDFSDEQKIPLPPALLRVAEYDDTFGVYEREHPHSVPPQLIGDTHPGVVCKYQDSALTEASTRERFKRKNKWNDVNVLDDPYNMFVDFQNLSQLSDCNEMELEDEDNFYLLLKETLSMKITAFKRRALMTGDRIYPPSFSRIPSREVLDEEDLVKGSVASSVGQEEKVNHPSLTASSSVSVPLSSTDDHGTDAVVSKESQTIPSVLSTPRSVQHIPVPTASRTKTEKLPRSFPSGSLPRNVSTPLRSGKNSMNAPPPSPSIPRYIASPIRGNRNSFTYGMSPVSASKENARLDMNSTFVRTPNSNVSILTTPNRPRILPPTGRNVSQMDQKSNANIRVQEQERDSRHRVKCSGIPPPKVDISRTLNRYGFRK